MSDKYMIFNEDCLEALKQLPDNSIDSAVTDPPAGISFMGKKWDEDKGGSKQWIAWMSDVMKECLRVLKPGAHGFVWAIPRTSHWTAMALEDAGFEIRDVVTHLFGSGFPKSLDISKAIDKAAGVERQQIGYKRSPDGRDYSKEQSAKDGLSKGTTFSVGQSLDKLKLTAPSTDAAKQWQGWGTALKPASEHWILVRKPISEKTIAANVSKHGTGGINIDASRIVHVSQEDFDESFNKNQHKDFGTGPMQNAIYGKYNKDLENYNPLKGRWPANLILDEEAGQLLGEPSRFFYCPKTSKRERVEGCEMNSHPTVKSLALMKYLITMITPPNGTILDPFLGSGSTGVAAIQLGFQFIGIEKEAAYVTIAEKRLEYASRKADNNQDDS